MDDQKYVLNNEEEQIQIELETKALVKHIVSELVSERKRQGITQQEVADITGMKAPNVTRIESCKYTPTLEVLIRYAKAVGKELHIEMVDADRNNEMK